MKKYDLCVAYRICPINSKSLQRPVFSQNKLKLSEFCLKSFRKSLGNLKVKLFIILDHCPKAYEQIFLKRFKKEDLIFIRIPSKKRKQGVEKSGGNLYTFFKQIEILLKQNFSDKIYLSEDDYCYTPNSFKKMLDFLDHPGIDFITAYDHPDYYTLKLHRYPQKCIKFNGYLWKSVGSTCCTFLTTKDKLKEIAEVFKKIKYLLNECPIWFALTKKRLFIDKRFWKFDNPIWRIWKQVLFGKKYTLWATVPSIATHMEKEFLAPTTNWEKDWPTHPKSNINSLLQTDRVCKKCITHSSLIK